VTAMVATTTKPMAAVTRLAKNWRSICEPMRLAW
jgi:hypothetical protein